VRIGDVFIFWHQLQEEYKGELRPHDFAVHDILPRGYAYIVFRDEVLRDEFNKVAEEIMADGTYEAVFEKYMQKLGLTE
jgi:ABC-type amino acid transport substrate-binding protein